MTPAEGILSWDEAEIDKPTPFPLPDGETESRSILTMSPNTGDKVEPRVQVSFHPS